MLWYGSILVAAVLYIAAAGKVEAPVIKAPTADSVRQELANLGEITWHQMPLRDGLDTLSKVWNIPIFLDRRVDPDQRIDFSAQRQSREDLLRSLAEQLQLKVCVVDTVVYIGPASSADTVASIAEARFDKATSWGKEAGRQLRKRSSLQWEEAAEPRAIVEQLATDHRIGVEGLDQVPHDLWPAANWQSLPVTHQLALLLTGFGYTYDLSNDGPDAKIKIIPLPKTFLLERQYQATGNAQQRLQQLKEKYPQAQFTLKGKSLAVVASAEEHYWIRRQLLGMSAFKPKREAEKRYQLTISTATFDAVAKTIANNLGLKLKYDPALPDIKSKRIEFSVQNATREQLLDALVKTVGVRYAIEGGDLIIRP